MAMLLSQGRPTRDCLTRRANCMSDIARHAEDSKPGVDIVVYGRRVTSAHLAAAAGVVVMDDPQSAGKLQVEAVMAVQERKDQGRIFV